MFLTKYTYTNLTRNSIVKIVTLTAFVAIAAFGRRENIKKAARSDSLTYRSRKCGSFNCSPTHTSFLGSVDLGELDAFVVEENLHIVEQKFMAVRV